jgi:two-component system chemotaxis response regulator CheY
VRFLVIDDEYAALHKMLALLKPYGQCTPATHADQAMELFRTALKEGAPYNLVTLDIDMPGMNGVDLLRGLRRQEHLARIAPTKIIMVTADGTATNVRRAIAAQCNDYLVKPIKKGILVRKLRELKLIVQESAAE